MKAMYTVEAREYLQCFYNLQSGLCSCKNKSCCAKSSYTYDSLMVVEKAMLFYLKFLVACLKNPFRHPSKHELARLRKISNYAKKTYLTRKLQE